MHEWALAEAVISAASKLAEERGLKRVKLIRLRIGELQQIDLEIFKYALDQIARERLPEARFEMTVEDAEFRCRVCGRVWRFRRDELDPSVQEAIHVIPEVAHAFLKCPSCGSSDFEVIKGRGVSIESMVGEADQ